MLKFFPKCTFTGTLRLWFKGFKFKEFRQGSSGTLPSSVYIQQILTLTFLKFSPTVRICTFVPNSRISWGCTQDTAPAFTLLGSTFKSISGTICQKPLTLQWIEIFLHRPVYHREKSSTETNQGINKYTSTAVSFLQAERKSEIEIHSYLTRHKIFT